MTYGEVISKGNNQEEIFYKEYGDCQGDWILITKDKNNFYIYKGYYGSCPGCDHLEDFEGYEDNFWTEEKYKEFCKEYPPFISIDSETFINICKSGMLKTIMPANTRLSYSVDYEEIPDDVVYIDIQNSIKSVFK